jgi:diketogulonate reductase-like aldo/keto reductase
LGECAKTAENEKAALLRGLSLGMKLIDTAEIYGGGGSELLIGDMLRARMCRRADVIIMTKAAPANASPSAALYNACEASLRRLGTDYIDYYLLHWRDDGGGSGGSSDSEGGSSGSGGAECASASGVNIVARDALAETAYGMNELVRRGLIWRWGVSNFDVCDMSELFESEGGANCAVNQVLYHLGSRGIEYDLLPWLRDHRVEAVAYCPLAQGGKLRRTASDFTTDATLCGLAKKYNANVFQIMLAFIIRNNNICAIPKAASIAHVEENAAAAALAAAIEPRDWATLDAAYPPPSYKMHLDMD